MQNKERAAIIDTETTGIKEPVPCEVAYWVIEDLKMIPVEQYCQRFNPSKPISLGATAVNNIRNKDVQNEPPFSTFKMPDVDYIIAHNSDYDWNALGKPDVKRIDTLAICRAMWPELDSHSQAAMAYHLYEDDAYQLLKKAHSAEADIKTLRLIIMGILAEMERRNYNVTTIYQLWRLSEKARIPKVMPFGKHQGTKIEELDDSYVDWLVNKADNKDEYLMKALKPHFPQFFKGKE